ncbi:MAG: exodeoxyribonuclease VII large subunit, partial [Pseudomonadota bacterium]
MQPDTSHNQITYNVSEISNALKRLVEDNFGHVRVKGEISGFKLATSGHAYLKLKDENSLLDAVGWKGVIAKIPFKLEDGLEVICHGKLTTYPGRSNYQLIIDYIEPAGIGALMALLEKRKQMLAAEGLFDQNRKKPLPFMPQIIGVVTSPTGAVIRDILHRISDRFPCHVIVWGTAVQGEGAAAQIASAIEGFNKLESNLKPDVIIV